MKNCLRIPFLFKLILILISIVLLLCIYRFPPLKLEENLEFKPSTIFKPNKLGIQLLIAEHEKVTNEISGRTKDNSYWFYTKFILVGGLISGILAYVLRKEISIDFEALVGKKSVTMTIGISVVLSVIIDIQQRQNTLVTMQLGEWVTYQYEPVMKASFDTSKNFYGWEEFLRVEPPNRCQMFQIRSGMCYA